MNVFQNVFGVMAGVYSALMATLNSAKPVITFSRGLVFAIICGYVCLKFFEMLGECEGQSISQRLMNAYKQFRKQFIIYVLVVSAPFVFSAMATMAKGFVQKSFAVVNALDGVAAQADGAVSSLLQSYDSIRQGCAAAVGWTTSKYNAASRSVEIRNLQMSPEAKAIRKSLVDVTDKMRQNIAAIPNPAQGSPDEARKRLLQQAVQRNEGLLRSGDQALSNISDQEKADWKAYTQATNQRATESTTNLLLGHLSPLNPKDVLTGGLLSPVIRGAVSDIKEWAENILISIVAAIVLLFAGAGPVSFGLTTVKQGMAVLGYVVGIWMAVAVGAAIALPVAGLFMALWLWEKTESYARNFVSFWFSMVFGCVGLATIAALIAQTIRVAVPMIVAPGMQAIIGLAGANSWTDIGLQVLGIFGFFFGAGAVLSFLCGSLRRGLSIGTGFWSGTFTA